MTRNSASQQVLDASVASDANQLAERWPLAERCPGSVWRLLTGLQLANGR